MNKYIFKVTGMHCASCEMLIEEKLIQLPEVEAIDASAPKGMVTIYTEGKKPSLETLNNLLKEDNYCACEECELPVKEEEGLNTGSLLTSLAIAVAVFLGFLFLNNMGVSGLLNVSASSSLPAFLLFGLLAGVSTCAALTGGIVLSMSQQWQEGFAKNDSLTEKMKPHILFNIGRLASYTLVGGLLGIIGSRLQLSLTVSAMLVIAVSIFMILNGLKMLGVPSLAKFQIALPKSITHKARDQKNFQGKYMPTLMGFLTFLLPCGFTITTESMALLSGNPIQGALIMFAFALGTLPGLLVIGFSSIKLGNSSYSHQFLRVAGALVLLFAVFNINAQFNVLGLPTLNSLNTNTVVAVSDPAAGQTDKTLAPIVNGKQLIQMQASSRGYAPNYFKIRAGMPVRWEITDTGTSGCTNAVIANGLFQGQIALTPGQVSSKEFTVEKPGKYRFSCWMGMISGSIEVVSKDGTAGSVQGVQTAEVPSGANGCGCGGGGGSSCGGAR
ncbi:MAG: sulfite exporter TauE/SafE family protein [bacterium]|nr:sulfite exporter TauE/SafE family protein [bacterium]